MTKLFELNKNLFFIDGFYYGVKPIDGFKHRYYMDDIGSVRQNVVREKEYWDVRKNYYEVLFSNNPSLKGIPFLMVEKPIQFTLEDVIAGFEKGYECAKNAGYKIDGTYQEDQCKFLNSLCPKIKSVVADSRDEKLYYLYCFT